MEVNIKTFIEEVQDYKQKRTEVISVKLQRYLQTLSASSDTSIYDPSANSGAEFFVSLYELMSVIEPNCGLMWSAVATLEEAIKVPAAQHALIHTFKFTPIFTELLKNCSNNDRRVQVLRLLQNCTYGIKIQWQESYLNPLISLLIEWTTCTEVNNDLVSLSLGVLVNLCFNNPPAIYTLKGSIEVKNLVQAILALPRNNLDIRVQAYRLLFILREIQGELPDDEILPAIKWTFKRLQESFQARSCYTMKHIVDCFRDIQSSTNFTKVLHTHQSFKQDVDNLIKLLENNTPGYATECTVLMLEFLQALIELDSPEKELGYDRLLKIALTLAEVDTRISRCTFHLVKAILINSNLESQIESENYLLGDLEDYLKVVLSVMEEKTKSVSDDKSWMVDLLTLLLECSNAPNLQDKISSSLNISAIKNIFKEDSSCLNSESLFDPTLNALYIKSFALVSALSKSSVAWNSLLNDLKGSKKLESRLAAALYTGERDIKLLVLQLLQQINDSSTLDEISQNLVDLSAFLVPHAAQQSNGLAPNNCLPVSRSEIYMNGPLFTDMQKKQLADCINKVTNAIAKNELSEVGMDTVLELYRCRVSSLTHAESVLQGSVQRADRQCSQLQHRLACMSAESARLLNLLHAKQLSVIANSQLIAKHKHELSDMERAVHAARNQCANIIEELKSKQNLNSELTNKIKFLNEELEEVKTLNSSLVSNNETLVSQIKHHTEKQKGLEERILGLQ
ncbi:hypothetical protein LSTR_LSTR013250 [Laodelphax striatellus]|uniref:Protein CIP2A n=1 Tax=Laodelphax striatellus TaxID=195883 RepID=A0A482WMQ6_LAOST|nr:hypothetical protein LSTR_LSTR013250 [Laodelphax striatellus]